MTENLTSQIFKGEGGAEFTLADLITPGTVFDTEFETGCVVVDDPQGMYLTFKGSSFNFTARDSDGVECGFNSAMITKIHSQEG